VAQKKGSWARLITLVSISIVLALLMFSGRLLAQSADTATILGTVFDTSGAVVPNAAVIVENTATGLTRSTTSGGGGDYILPSLPTGNYVVKISSAGFQTFEQDRVLLHTNSSVRVDGRLTVGTTTQSVVVTSAPPLLNTSENTLQTVIEQERVSALPLNGRNPLQLTLLVPGVNQNSGVDSSVGSTRPEEQYISVNGGRGDTTVYKLDGGDNNDLYTNVANVYPNPDALQEFTFQTNNYSAEYGWRTGGVVNATTRSGANQFHGTTFEYLRNAAVNATNFFTPGVSDGLKRHQFGGSLGGPIFKNKTFFFANYQGTTLRQALAASPQIVPTAAEISGDFSAISQQLIDPLTGVKFSGNQIPAARFDSVAVKLLKYLPVSKNANGSVPISTLNNDNDYQVTGRIDHQATSTDRLTARYLYDRLTHPNPINPANLLSAVQYESFFSHNGMIAETHVFSASLLMTTSITFNRLVSTFNYGYPTTFADLGASIVNLSSNKDIYLIVGSYFTIPKVAASDQIRNLYDTQSSAIYSRGRHELKFGGELIRQQFTLPNVPYNSNGEFVFNNQRSGNNLVDFLLGAPASFTQSSPQTEAMRAWLPAFYANDNFRLTHSVSLNLGLRYQPFLPWIDQHNNQTAVFRPGAQSVLYPNMPPDILLGGDPGITKFGYNRNLAQFEPRVGLAWHLYRQMTLRGGFGLFHDFPPSVLNNHISLAAPYAVAITIQQPSSIVNPFTTSQPDPFPTTLPPPSTYSFPRPLAPVVYDPNFTNAQVLQYNASVEQELGKSWMLTVAYRGGEGSRLLANEEANPATFIPGTSSLSNVNQRRPYYPNYGAVAQIQSSGISHYNGLSGEIQKRFDKYYSLLSSYTWAHSSDLNSAELAGGVGEFYTNPANKNYDWANSDFDVRNRFVASIVATSSPLAGHNFIYRDVAGNWEADLIGSVQSGTPLTVLDGVNQSLNGVQGPEDRPNTIGDPRLSSKRNDLEKAAEYFDTSAFQLNALGSYGNTPRNSLKAPGYFDIDVALVKTFPIYGSFSGQFRAETFNLLNEVNFAAQNASSIVPANEEMNSPLFGRLTVANPPRIFQFALRINF